MKITQEMFVKINGSREVFKVFSVDRNQAYLIDAENKHCGGYPLDELKIVKKVKTVSIWVKQNE